MVTLGKNAAGLPAFTGERPLRVLGATILPQALWILGVALAIMVGPAALLRPHPGRQGHAGGGHRPGGGAAGRDQGRAHGHALVCPRGGGGRGGRHHHHAR